MANKKMFKSAKAHEIEVKHTVNEAGGAAMKLDPEELLAQYACTGTFYNTFYATGEKQLETLLEAARKVDPNFVIDVAVYSRKKAWMKDMPAALMAFAASQTGVDRVKFNEAFPHVIDNGRMLRNFAQFIRSGRFGRKSFGTWLKKLIEHWLNKRHPAALFRDSVGNDPSIADIIHMIHPKPSDQARSNLYAYLIGRNYNEELLPEVAKVFEEWKAGYRNRKPKGIEFRLLTSIPDLSTRDWKVLGHQMGLHALRMNLNTLERHEVLKDTGFVEYAVEQLTDVEQIKKQRIFPYQLYQTYRHLNEGIPTKIKNALHDTVEISIDNVPRFGKAAVCVDVSYSMQALAVGKATTRGGWRRAGARDVRCCEVAALMAACILHSQPDAKVVQFDTAAKLASVTDRDSIFTLVNQLARSGGGTDCSSAIQYLIDNKIFDLDAVVILSDMESWADFSNDPARHYTKNRTGLQYYWDEWKKRADRPDAKLVLIDLQPHPTTQVVNRPDVLNVGGFNDSVFDAISTFLEDRGGTNHWVDAIKKGLV